MLDGDTNTIHKYNERRKTHQKQSHDHGRTIVIVLPARARHHAADRIVVDYSSRFTRHARTRAGCGRVLARRAGRTDVCAGHVLPRVAVCELEHHVG